jgi:DNA-binding Xre family transcriptional regulator
VLCVLLPALPLAVSIGKPDEKKRIDILKVLAQNVWTWRIFNGFNLQRLAALCGFTVERVDEIEDAKHNITLGDLETMADQLNCRVYDLVRHK